MIDRIAAQAGGACPRVLPQAPIRRPPHLKRPHGCMVTQMNDEIELKEALDFISPASLTYEE